MTYIITPLMTNKFVKDALNKICVCNDRKLIYMSELRWNYKYIKFIPLALLFYFSNRDNLWNACAQRSSRKSGQPQAPMVLTILLFLKNFYLSTIIIAFIRDKNILFLPTSEPYIESILLRLISRKFCQPCLTYTAREYMGFVVEPKMYYPTIIDIENIQKTLSNIPDDFYLGIKSYSTGGEFVSAYNQTKNTLFEGKLQDACVVFLHDVLDAPGIFGKGNYNNLVDWMTDTINVLRSNKIKFFIKPHPNQINASKAFLNDFFNKNDLNSHIIDLSSSEILHKKPKLIVTNHGSISLEALASGLPVLVAGEALVTLTGIMKKLSNKNEYKDHLKRMKGNIADIKLAKHFLNAAKKADFKWKIDKPILFDYSLLSKYNYLKTNEDLLKFCHSDPEFIKDQENRLDIKDVEIFENAFEEAVLSSSENTIAIIVTEDFTYKYYIDDLVKSSDNDFIIMGNFKTKDRGVRFFGSNKVIFENIGITRKKLGIDNFLTILRIVNIIKKYNVKKVITVMPKANLLGQIASKISGIKDSYAILTGNIWLDRTGLSRWGLFFVERIIISLSSTSVADSNSQYKLLQKKHPNLKNKLRFVNGLTARKFEVDKGQIKKIDNDIIVGHIGRLNSRKGSDEAILIAERCLSDACQILFKFVGPSEDKIIDHSIISLMKKNPDRVSYKEGFFDFRQEVEKIDILLMPSKYEGFGIAAVEAAKLGKVVIGYDVIGLKDSILQNITGHKVKLNDIDAIVTLLKMYSKDPIKLMKQQNLSLKISREEFSSDKLINNLKKALELTK